MTERASHLAEQFCFREQLISIPDQSSINPHSEEQIGDPASSCISLRPEVQSFILGG